MKYNRELQFIDTAEKAYLLGLFYSDGCISTKGNICSMSFHKKDVDFVLNVQKIFPFFKVVNYSKSKSNPNVYTLIKADKLLKLDLINNGLVTRKSFENKDKLLFPKIEYSFYSHFIRGLFDGDGSVYFQKVNNLKCDISQVNFHLLMEVLKVLIDQDINFSFNTRLATLRKINEEINPKGNFNAKQNVFRIYSSSFRESSKFRDFIYKDATICMQRKYDIMHRIPLYKVPLNRIPCPLCGSIKTMYNGYRGNKIRIHCNSCNKKSTVAPISGDINSVSDKPIN